MCRAPAPRKRRPMLEVISESPLVDTILDRAEQLHTVFTNALGGPHCVSSSEAADINRAVELVIIAEADLHASADAALHAFQSVERAQVAIDGLRLVGGAGQIFDRG
jgi:hypothetical protein